MRCRENGANIERALIWESLFSCAGANSIANGSALASCPLGDYSLRSLYSVLIGQQ